MAYQTILDIPVILNCAKLAESYAAIDKVKTGIFGGGIVEDLLAEKIYLVRKGIQNRYDKNPSDTSLRGTANLLWSLCGKYGLQALNNIQGGGIVINPVSNVDSYLAVLKNYRQFVIGDASSPIPVGGTTLTITDSLIVPESLDAQVEIHLDGGELGEQILGRESYTAIYSPGQYVINFTDPLMPPNLVQIKYPVRKNLVYTATTPSGNNSIIYTATIINTATQKLLDTSGNIFKIQLGTQGKLYIELSGEDQNGAAFLGSWNYGVRNPNGTIELSLADGGIYYTYSGGDIGSNIVIQKNDALGGVEMLITGFAGKTIVANAKFTYSPFTI